MAKRIKDLLVLEEGRFSVNGYIIDSSEKEDMDFVVYKSSEKKGLDMNFEDVEFSILDFSNEKTFFSLLKELGISPKKNEKLYVRKHVKEMVQMICNLN